ncbi:MAG: N-acetylmuramoyl-L-alanine amidase, partial [Clostridia bacterium]|nr:N-acetylmuramoyl-L-alanine amidase [Clostridia bacterium]
MKQHIAKLLVFLMLMTTMIVPADLSFAESGNENTTQTEEPSVQPENQQTTTETKAAQQSTNAKKDIVAVEEQQLEETITERMEFLYIESKELVAPGTQNIVVSWKEAIDDIQNMVLVYENEQGKTFTLKESKRNDESIVFTKDFTASEAGTYKIKGVQYFVGNEEKHFAFDDVEIAASFKVVKGQAIEDDAIAKVEVESNGAVDKKEVNAEIKDAVTSTDAAPKAQTKARSTKSSNIVVVLDPGHGGKDSGATRGSVYEKTINFKVASYCKAELEKYYGVTVYMTRTGDTNPSLEARARFAASKNADILVSIHQNSGSSSSRGAEVYYPNKNYKPAIGNSGKAVANSIQKELVSLGLNNRGTKIRNTANGSTYADGSYSDYYGIIRNSKNLGVPAIIVEHAFLSNASDYNNFLSSDSKLQKLGIADATGIAKAFGLQKEVPRLVVKDGKTYCYVGNDQLYGEQCVSEKWYYFDAKTGEMATGWIDLPTKRVYYGEDGAMLYGKQKIEGKTYYFDKATGALQKGKEVEIEGHWHYFDPKTGEMETGWVDLPTKQVCYGEDGAMLYGKQKIDGKIYYFNKATGALQ